MARKVFSTLAFRNGIQAMERGEVDIFDQRNSCWKLNGHDEVATKIRAATLAEFSGVRSGKEKLPEYLRQRPGLFG